MAGWIEHSGTALGLPIENIDTDQLIPARFMSVSRADGYGPYLLHDLRNEPDGTATDFILNTLEPSVLVTRRNFGTGSSREAAVYALVDFGIKAVIAPSFGDIFASNAVNNGLLPAQVSENDVEQLLGKTTSELCPVHINLETQKITWDKKGMNFTLDPVWRMKLRNGWNDIDLTLSHAQAIAEFGQSRPAWTEPNRSA